MINTKGAQSMARIKIYMDTYDENALRYIYMQTSLELGIHGPASALR